MQILANWCNLVVRCADDVSSIGWACRFVWQPGRSMEITIALQSAVEREMLNAGCVVSCVMSSLLIGWVPERSTTADTPDKAKELSTLTARVPGTVVPFELARCEPGVVILDDTSEHAIDAMWALTTEVTWDLYDIYVYKLDEADASSAADAVSRPSKPYVPPDRGFGHDGYPAIGMTRKAAEGFCEWLTLKIGVEVRLPTQPEWVHLASGGEPSDYCCGASSETLGEFAWLANNSEHSTHPVGSKAPNGFGLYDVHGNAAEWVITQTRRPYAMGGGYRDAAEDATVMSAQRQMSSWNQSDPQIPNSQWWLADCSWVGFRFVIDATDENTKRLEELRDE